MKLSEFINKLKQFNFKKQLKLSEQPIKFDELYKEILINIEIIKNEILIPLWDHPSYYFPVVLNNSILYDNKIYIHDFRLSKLTFLKITKNDVTIKLEGFLLNDNYEIIKKSNFNYIILENTKTLSFETAFEYLKLFNKDLKHIIKNKSKIYKDILKTLF